MFNLRSLAVAAATVAIVLVAWSCDTQREPLGPTIGPPLFHFGVPLCIPFKMTGGGRIDFPEGTAEKNPPASQQFQTFGAHVIASAEEVNGECLRTLKGSLQWVDHSIRINGRPLNLHSTEITFADAFGAPETACADGGARWGGTLLVRNTGDDEVHNFTVFDCDDGEPGARNDGFGISTTIRVNGVLVPYEVLCPDETSAGPTCTLTGGNRQFHRPPN